MVFPATSQYVAYCGICAGGADDILLLHKALLNKQKRLYNELRTLMSRFSETLHLKIDVISPLQRRERATAKANTVTQIKKKS